jgi:DNA repair protein RadC
VDLARDSGAAAVWRAANHPDGARHMSEEGKSLIKQLEHMLASAKISLFEHAIVAGDPARILKSHSPLLTSRHIAQPR